MRTLSSLILVCLASMAAAEESRPPNIVLILVDDLGWTDLGCQGSGFYETPNIDRLAAEGLRLTDAYSSAPNCAPTRACLMSGQATPRHGIYTVGSGARGKKADRRLEPVPNRKTLDAEVETLGDRIKAAGYATAHMGKWHLGKPGEAGPKEQGFDINIGGDQRGHPPTYFSPYRIGPLNDGPDGEYLTDRLNTEALEFVDEHREEPFFLYLAHYAVHTPIQGKPELQKHYEAKERAGGHRNAAYAAMIQSVDEGVGQLLGLLDELELADRTCVILTSDNGGLGGYAAAGVRMQSVTDNAPLRGGKGMLYEGGIRVPFLARWPGRFPQKKLVDVPVITHDLYPTLISIAGGTPLEDVPLDGHDLTELLCSGGTTRPDRSALHWHFPGYLQGAKGSWRTTPASAVRAGTLKLLEFHEDGRLELYDLASDIGEQHDLAEKQPEDLARLHSMMRSWRAEIHAPMPTRKP